MHILIAGGTGLLGTALCQALMHAGHRITLLTRNTTRVQRSNPQTLVWKPCQQSTWIQDLNHLPPIDTVVNLCGNNIARPWTTHMRNAIINSRIQPQRALLEWCKQCPKPPKHYIQASGIDYYSFSPKVAHDEHGAQGAHFLAQACQQWEHLTTQYTELNTSYTIVRYAPVLSDQGGLFPKLYYSTLCGLGAYQIFNNPTFSWIHIHDATRIVMDLIQHPSSAPKIINACAPNPIPYNNFAKKLCQQLRRPCWIPLLPSLLRGVMGEASSLILNSRWVVSQELEQRNFQFTYPKMDQALQQLCSH